ncbi:MAG: hypothetical protein IJZ29_04090 [Clostridia bacterium]|nr:hypothetical protein [Clostridia bacterium]
MKKRIACLMICFITMCTCLSGCGLFVLDQERYLNEVVASVGDIEITKEKLLVMYNNYADTLINSYGYTRKQAVNYCLDSLINSAILTEKGKNELVLSDEQMTAIVSETLTYFNALVADYEAEVRAEWDRISTIPESTEEGKTVYEHYHKVGKLVNVGTDDAPIYEIQATNEHDHEHAINQDYIQIVQDYIDGKKINLLTEFKKQWVPEFEDVGEEALKRVAIEYRAQYDAYKDLTYDEVLEKALQKHFVNVVDNAYITAIDEEYQETIVTTINTQMIMEEYYRIVNDNKAKYDLDTVGYSQYIKDILSSAEGIYYHPIENEFFYVSNVLLQFSEEQQAEIDVEKKLLEQGFITQADYDKFVEDLAKEIKVNAIDENGNVTDNAYTAEEILLEIQTAVNSAVTPEEKAKAYNEFVYKYNSDPGIQNANRDYVIGIPNEEDEDEVRSNMVESFTEASRALYNNGEGEIGSISGLVATEYGYHIIMYTGKIENIETNQNADEVCLKLDSIRTTLHSEKTIFDEVLESLLTQQNKGEDVKMLYINDYKANNKVIKYTDRVKELYE